MKRILAPTRGVALVEFALVTPVALFLLLNLAQLGLILSSYVSVTNVAREASRAAIVADEGDRLAAAEQAVYNGDDTTGVPTGFAMSTGYISGVNVSLPAEDPILYPNRKGQTLTTTVTWVITMDLGMLFPTPDITVQAVSKMRIE